MRIDERIITELKPYENNPRVNDGAVEYVAESIREFGFKNPIIIDEKDVIVAGHTRMKAAELLGLEKVPTIKVTDLTEEQINAFRIADNKTAEKAEWDDELLKEELEKVGDLFTGFDDEELNQLYFEDIEYKEKEPAEKETIMKIKFDDAGDFKKLEEDLRKLIAEKYDRVRVVVSSGEV